MMYHCADVVPGIEYNKLAKIIGFPFGNTYAARARAIRKHAKDAHSVL
jgi:hypothetical protein